MSRLKLISSLLLLNFIKYKKKLNKARLKSDDSSNDSSSSSRSSSCSGQVGLSKIQVGSGQVKNADPNMNWIGSSAKNTHYVISNAFYYQIFRRQNVGRRKVSQRKVAAEMSVYQQSHMREKSHFLNLILTHIETHLSCNQAVYSNFYSACLHTMHFRFFSL